MSNALALLSPAELIVARDYAAQLADSGLLPASYRKQPANVFYAIEFGRMIAIPPMAAVLGIHVIEGKPTASAALIAALVRRAGHRIRVSGDDQSATVTIVRSDDPDYTFSATWTIQRAKNALLTGKDVWKKYPGAMLKARATTEVARDACQEVLFGLLYTPEELNVQVNADGEPILDHRGVVIVDSTAVEDAEPLMTPAGAADYLLMINTLPVDELRDLAIGIGDVRGWTVETDGTTLRQHFVQRLGREALATTWQGPLREVWKIMRGTGLDGETFHEDGLTDIGPDSPRVRLGTLLDDRAQQLPAQQPEYETDVEVINHVFVATELLDETGTVAATTEVAA